MYAKVLSVCILITAIAVIVGLAMLEAHVVYGDWTCAFAKCVKVKGAP